MNHRSLADMQSSVYICACEHPILSGCVSVEVVVWWRKNQPSKTLSRSVQQSNLPNPAGDSCTRALRYWDLEVFHQVLRRQNWTSWRDASNPTPEGDIHHWQDWKGWLTASMIGACNLMKHPTGIWEYHIYWHRMQSQGVRTNCLKSQHLIQMSYRICWKYDHVAWYDKKYICQNEQDSCCQDLQSSIYMCLSSACNRNKINDIKKTSTGAINKWSTLCAGWVKPGKASCEGPLHQW